MNERGILGEMFASEEWRFFAFSAACLLLVAKVKSKQAEFSLFY
jgi:hypothetical protein